MGGGGGGHRCQIIGFKGFKGFGNAEKPYKTLLKPIIHQICVLPNIGYYWFYAGFRRFLKQNVVFP